MTRSTRVLLATAFAGALVAAVASPTLAQSPRRGGVFRLPAPDAVSLDPHLIPGFTGQMYAGLVYSHLYLPMWPRYIAHPPYVKGFKHIDGYGLGTRLMYVWLDR